MLKQTRKRYIEFDILRAAAIMLLPLIHLYEELHDQGLLTSMASRSQHWILYLCVYAPSVFMLCFGANLFFAREKTPAEYAKRGVRFLLIGVSLSAVRFVFPTLIAELCGKQGEIVKSIGNLFFSDIYDFVGAFLLLYALFKKLKLSDFTMLMIAFAMMFVNTYFSGISTDNKWIDGFLGRLIYINKDSYFPLLSWTMFPILGIYVGKIYQSIQEKDRGQIMMKCLIGSLFADGLIYITLKSYGLSYFKIAVSVSNEYKTDFINVIILLLIFAKLLPIAYWLVVKFSQSRPIQWLLSISSVIMAFYVIQWVIVAWLEYILVYAQLTEKISVELFYVIFAGVMIFTLVLTKLFGKKLQAFLNK